MNTSHSRGNIETVSLDAGGVLINPNWQRISAELAVRGITVDARALEAAEPAAKKQFDNTTIIEADKKATGGWGYFNRVLEGAGITPSKATNAAFEVLKEYHIRHNLWESIDPGARETLEAIRANGLKRIVVSNANGNLKPLLDRLDLTHYFDVIVDSYIEGVEKPDPRLFHIAMSRAGARPERTLHIGDFYHIDIVGARAAGMHALLIDKADLYRDADCPRVRSVADVPSYLFG